MDSRWVLAPFRTLRLAGDHSSRSSGSARLHAVRHVYGYTGSDSLRRSFAYVVLFARLVLSVGLPELLRSPRAASTATSPHVPAAALGISVSQLVTNSVLLPRLVVFGAAVVLAPWFVLCATLARHARSRAEDRERLLFIGRSDEGHLLRDELGDDPELPAQLVAVLGCEPAARSTGPARSSPRRSNRTRRCSCWTARRKLTSTSLRRLPFCTSGERGVRTVSLFYEQWLGKLPLAELERCLAHVRHRRDPSRQLQQSEAHDRHRLAVLCLPALALALPVGSRSRTAWAIGGSLFFRPARVGKAGPRVHDLEVPNDEGTAGSSDPVDRR